MNATKFVVVLFIGVLCAKIDSRKLEKVSKDSKLSTITPKATTKGVEDDLSAVSINDFMSGYGNGYNSFTEDPEGSISYTTGSGSGSFGGTVVAEAPRADGSIDGESFGTGGANIQVGSDGISGGGGGTGSAKGNTGGITQPN